MSPDLLFSTFALHHYPSPLVFSSSLSFFLPFYLPGGYPAWNCSLFISLVPSPVRVAKKRPNSRESISSTPSSSFFLPSHVDNGAGMSQRQGRLMEDDLRSLNFACSLVISEPEIEPENQESREKNPNHLMNRDDGSVVPSIEQMFRAA